MRATERLPSEGQGLWLDNITRKMLDSGQIAHYVEHYWVTGLTSNPSIFDKAIASGDYDTEIRDKAARGITGEELFFAPAIEDLRRAADLFLPIHERTDGVDGWVSLEVSPLLAHDANSTIAAARALHERAARANLFIKIPGTAEGCVASEECIAVGIPVNVTLLFSADHYRAAAEVYLRGIERRVASRLGARVGSVASAGEIMSAVLPERSAWKALERHHGELAGRHLRELFAEDPVRAERFAFDAAGLHLDYSKNRINDEPMRLLLQLADESGLRRRIDAMFRGDRSNVSEDRPALHTALRVPEDESLIADGQDGRFILGEPRSAGAALGLPAGTRACLFDLDGVLTQTAKLHAAAWQRMFDDYLLDWANTCSEPFVPFDPVRDYTLYVDGKLRIDGARSFLASRGIELTEDALAGLAARKDELLIDLLGHERVEVYDGSVRYVHAARQAGLRTAVVSSSRHTAQVLASAGIADLFDARIDGVVAAAEHLAGKPAPDTYLAAAHALGVDAAQAVVFEDALAGVEAGRAGHFGYVVGVDRVGQAAELRRHGADVVVSDLAALLEHP
ncbi:MAG: Beta-phosphoglucomutase [bacterium]|nr:Beta-phosphoglucomutase [bacterium]